MNFLKEFVLVLAIAVSFSSSSIIEKSILQQFNHVTRGWILNLGLVYSHYKFFILSFQDVLVIYHSSDDKRNLNGNYVNCSAWPRLG